MMAQLKSIIEKYLRGFFVEEKCECHKVKCPLCEKRFTLRKKVIRNNRDRLCYNCFASIHESGSRESRSGFMWDIHTLYNELIENSEGTNDFKLGYVSGLRDLIVRTKRYRYHNLDFNKKHWKILENSDNAIENELNRDA